MSEHDPREIVAVQVKIAELKGTIAEVKSAVMTGFASVQQRFTEQGAKLDAIEREGRITEGRVTRSEERINVLQRRRVEDDGDGILTIDRVKQFAAFGGWLVAAVLGWLTLAGVI